MIQVEESKYRELTQAAEILSLINVLRSDEGACVTLCNDNADFNGLPNCVIQVCGEWTDWSIRDFRADSVLECLRAASKAKSEQVVSKPGH